MTHNDDQILTARIPANVDQPDKIIYGLNARQVAILAATAALAFWVYLMAAPWLPMPALVVALFPIVVAGAVLAVARRDGMDLDRLALAALAHLRLPRARVSAPEGMPPPSWCRVRGRLPAPLRLPVRAVREDGVMELADGGKAVIVRAGTVAFALRTAAEQAALVAVFGRWLNSLDAPTQILVRARSVDLSGLAEHLTASAPALPDPALERAALDHAAFVAKLDRARELLVREVLIALRDQVPGSSTGQAPSWLHGGKRRAAREAGVDVVLRRADEAVRALSALGVTVEVLDADACMRVLSEALSPAEPPLAGTAGPDEVITRGRQAEEAAR